MVRAIALGLIASWLPSNGKCICLPAEGAGSSAWFWSGDASTVAGVVADLPGFGSEKCFTGGDETHAASGASTAICRLTGGAADLRGLLSDKCVFRHGDIFW